MNVISRINERIGKFAGFLVLPCIVVIVCDVFLRWAFDISLIWAFDTSIYLYAGIFLLAAGYTHLEGRHVAMDVLYEMWSPKVRAIVDIICYLLLCFPFLGVSIWLSGQAAIGSWQIGEKSISGGWFCPLYPLRVLLPLGLFLLLLQSVVKFTQSLKVAGSISRKKEGL